MIVSAVQRVLETIGLLRLTMPTLVRAAVSSTELSGHPLEIPELAPSDSFGERAGWMIASAIVGTIAFATYHFLHEWIKTRPQGDIDGRSKRHAGLGGPWVSPADGVWALFSDVPHEPWNLGIGTQAYELRVMHFDPTNGYANGTMSCTRNGHDVGEWQLAPAVSNLNRITLQVALRNGDQRSFTLHRAE